MRSGTADSRGQKRADRESQSLGVREHMGVTPRAQAALWAATVTSVCCVPGACRALHTCFCLLVPQESCFKNTIKKKKKEYHFTDGLIGGQRGYVTCGNLGSQDSNPSDPVQDCSNEAESKFIDYLSVYPSKCQVIVSCVLIMIFFPINMLEFTEFLNKTIFREK